MDPSGIPSFVHSATQLDITSMIPSDTQNFVLMTILSIVPFMHWLSHQNFHQWVPRISQVISQASYLQTYRLTSHQWFHLRFQACTMRYSEFRTFRYSIEHPINGSIRYPEFRTFSYSVRYHIIGSIRYTKLCSVQYFINGPINGPINCSMNESTGSSKLYPKLHIFKHIVWHPINGSIWCLKLCSIIYPINDSIRYSKRHHKFCTFSGTLWHPINAPIGCSKLCTIKYPKLRTFGYSI